MAAGRVLGAGTVAATRQNAQYSLRGVPFHRAVIGAPPTQRHITDPQPSLEGGIIRIDHNLGQERTDLEIDEVVAERLFEQVADHPVALGSEHFGRVGTRVGHDFRPKREQADLRAAAGG